MIAVSFDAILAARKRIAEHILVTPCAESPALSEITGVQLFCKREYLQRTGSFKERGARNALECLTESQRACGVIAASAGNHALALSYHGSRMGAPVTVVMPRFAPLIKVATCRNLQANVVLYGETIADARAHADELAQEQGLTYINGFDDPHVIAGQGVIGLEILEQVSDLHAMIVPIGGGGLIAGIALAVKTLHPEIEIIGVETENAASYQAALLAGHPVRIATRPTLADGLAVPQVGENAFALAQRYVDRVVSVSEDAVALAILRLLEREKGVVEGAGATPLAALFSQSLTDLQGKRVAITLCGGNIDPVTLGRIIDNGLVAEGRLCRFTALISDRPGGLAAFAQKIGETGASIRDIFHDRAFGGANVAEVQVQCIVETNDHAHIAALWAHLERNGIAILRPETERT